MIRPGELGPGEIAAWTSMQRATGSLASPFLCPEFAIAVDRVRSGARVAVLADGPQIAGFFPFQRRRLGVGVPIGAGADRLPGRYPRAGSGMGRAGPAPGLQAVGVAVRLPRRRPAAVRALRIGGGALARGRPGRRISPPTRKSSRRSPRSSARTWPARPASCSGRPASCVSWRTHAIRRSCAC